jgi:peptidyl-dipeptidase A
MKTLTLAFLVACGSQPGGPAPTKAAAPAQVGEPGPSAADAKKFVQRVDTELKEVWLENDEAQWAHMTDLRDETEAAASAAEEKTMGHRSALIADANAYRDVPGIDKNSQRQLMLLRRAVTLPAPFDDAGRAELAEITTRMSSTYGKGEYCNPPEKCRDLGELSEVIAKSRKPAELLDAWTGWRTVSPPMRSDYARFVELGNKGAKAIGFQDMGALWKSGYDMPPDDFEKEVDRLYKEVKPLYDQLHCYVRAELAETYGDKHVKSDGTIPAHLTGNMWAQSWEALYPIAAPFPKERSLDVSDALVAQKWDEKKMVRTAEAFFTSIGLNPLPDAFWKNSMLLQPEDREVVCHASAWDVGSRNDLRIKMCIKPTMEDLITIHHELGHIYYYNNYYTKPLLYQSGAHDGFHEAIGDAIALSMTPSYLGELGLLEGVSESKEQALNQQMMLALGKVAFLPFGRMIDQWRWDVFSGKVSPDDYNAHWWKLRGEFQGIGAPVERSETDFDPGAKYHIPGNTPYIRYFLAHILQFQFHESMCKAAGHEGPLSTCSVHGSKEAGAKLQALLELGASEPWPVAMERMTGSKNMSAEPLLAYFEPLSAWLDEQNKGRTCGW